MAKDSVTVTQIDELPGMPPAPKKRGRPATGKARSNASRQQKYRNSLKTSVYEIDDSEWSDAVCLYVLGSKDFAPGSALHKAAWQRLGQLSNYR